ncbi:unnamed protein product [Fraxinus pennsylvanica]|uniref:Nuclear pore complex protein NUP1-like n=1 Tax=Fraxinus pennsylvanica TaxID=56036 RepID=A0AAD1ZFI2_9LAMI|nr:unnamed protein product [Fraxinus pennsylvanica]
MRSSRKKRSCWQEEQRTNECIRRDHHTTPYDRPLTALRGIITGATNNNNASRSNKLVMDPASKLISYGAHRFFGKSLPPPPQLPKANNELSDGLQEAIPNSQSGAKEPADGSSSHPVNHSDIGGISELEQLLKHMTFTRSEIELLTEILRSRAEEVPVGKRTQEALPELASDLGRHQQLSSTSLEEDRYHGVNTTIASSRVLEDDIASPAELAKAYMGSGASKISPSKLGMRSQIGREDARLLSNVPFTPKAPVMSSTTRAAVDVGVPENGFITPRSRGRSAIYNMTRTPYPRVNPTAILKGSLFGNGSGSLESDTVAQSMPILCGSSLPSSSITNNTSFASSLANSQVPSTNSNFGFSSVASSSESNAVVPGSGLTVSVFNFGVSSAAFSDGGAISSSSGATPGIFSFGLSSSSSSANVVGSTSGAAPSVFSFGSSSAASTSGINAASSFSSGTYGIFRLGASSSAPSSATNVVISSNPTSNLFGSSWQSPESLILGSTFTSPSSSTGFAFGASASSFTATNTAPVVFNSSTGASSNPFFSFTAASAAALSSPSLSHTQTVFGNLPAFAASPGNGLMNAEDSMAEDTIRLSAPSVPVFGLPTVSPSPPGLMFESQPNPFQLGGQQNQVALQTSAPSVPVFGLPPVSHSPPRLMFGGQPNPFQLGGQQNQFALQTSAPSVPVFGLPTVSPSPPGLMFGRLGHNPIPFNLVASKKNQVAPQNFRHRLV